MQSVAISPEPDDHNVIVLLDLLNSEEEAIQVRFVNIPQTIQHDCFENVKKIIEKASGRTQLGWLIVKTDINYEAIAHAVWEAPNSPDDFADVTPYRGLTSQWRTFVPDDRMIDTGRFMPSVRYCHTGKATHEDYILLADTRDLVETLYLYSPLGFLIGPPSAGKAKVKLNAGFGKEFLLKMGAVSKSGNCYCNSGKKYVDCHRLIIRDQLNEIRTELNFQLIRS